MEEEKGGLIVDGKVVLLSEERTPCDIYARVVGYLRPVSQFNNGKAAEFRARANFEPKVMAQYAN